MTDLRGLSPGSKTAAVVILVVLLQVIVVAVLGLGAIGRDREEGARLSRADSERRALAEATQALDEAREGILGALQEAARIARNPGGLRNLPRDRWYRAFREVWLVDADGRVRSAGGTLLYVPPEVVAREEQRADRVLLERAEQAIDSMPVSDPAAAEARRRFVPAFPYHTDGAGYAKSVGWALLLAQDAAASPETSPVALADAVLRAWQTAAINEGRPAALAPGLAYVRRELARLVAEPGREALAEALDELERSRLALADLRGMALPLAQDAAAYPGPTRVLVLPRQGEVIGLASLPGPGPDERPQALLARMDRATLALLLDAPPAGSPTSTARVVERGLPSPGPTPAVRLPFERADFDPGLDVVVPLPVPRAADLGTGPREGFYWLILALGVLGVSAAGVVLFRVLRREVALASLKADFVSNLSHELKTPLTSIGMFTEMLGDRRLGEEERREAVEVISLESERLRRLVDRMIGFARLEAGSRPLALRPGDLAVTVRRACERFRRLERDPGLDLAWEFEPGLPPVAHDPEAVDDIVANLLSNAWKYRRGERARVRVGVARAGRGVELVVRDDGIGIPRRERRRVFRMFYRAENYLSRSVPGTGIGLSLVRRIVAMHGGRIQVEGALPTGTTFRIRLPAARAAAAAPATAAAPVAAPRPPRSKEERTTR